jgi:hypothetical protein
MLELPRNLDDDEAFVRLVTSLLRGVLANHHPSSFYLVKIDNWFGSNWLGFNRKILGLAGERVRNPTAPRLVPPFTPNRVIAEALFEQGPGERYVQREQAPALHRLQESEKNSRRQLSTIAPEAALFWWSARSALNSRGNVMSYLPGVSGHAGWYAGFKRDTKFERAGQTTIWRATELHGLARPELESYLKAS